MTTTPQTPPPLTEPTAAVPPSNLEARPPGLALKLLTALISIPLMSLATGFFPGSALPPLRTACGTDPAVPAA